MNYLQQFENVELQINNAIELALSNMLNKQLPWKRKRVIGFKIKMQWISSDMVGVAGVLVPDGNLPLCETTPFHFRVSYDTAGRIHVRIQTKQEAESENYNPNQVDAFAESNGHAPVDKDEESF